MSDKTAANTSSSTDTEQYGFDNNPNLTSLTKRSGQVINFVYDNLNRLLTRSYTNSAENVNFSYGLLGRRTLVIGATGADTVAYVFDNAGKTLSYHYDDLSRRTLITLGNGTTSAYTYSPQGTLATASAILA